MQPSCKGSLCFLFTTIIVLFIVHGSFAQSDREVMKRSYRFVQNVKLKMCNAVGDPLKITSVAITTPISVTATVASGNLTPISDNDLITTSISRGATISTTAMGAGKAMTVADTEEIIFEGVQFGIVKALDNAYVIRIFKKVGDAAFNAQYFGVNKAEPSKTDEQTIYFLLPRSEFQRSCDDRLAKSGAFTIGALIMPIKMRFGSSESLTTGSTVTHPKNFTFSGEISAGLLIGCKWDLTERSSISALTGISLTTIPLDKDNTGGFVPDPTNASALTWPTGLLLQYDKVQFGIFAGLDFLSGEVAHHWIYRNNLWVGLGVGFSIFTKRSTDSQ